MSRTHILVREIWATLTPSHDLYSVTTQTTEWSVGTGAYSKLAGSIKTEPVTTSDDILTGGGEQLRQHQQKVARRSGRVGSTGGLSTIQRPSDIITHLTNAQVQTGTKREKIIPALHWGIQNTSED